MNTDLLEKLYEKQERMAEDLADIKVILAKQEENLKIHIYRTDLAEENIALLRQEVKPVIAHVAGLKKAIEISLKTLGALSVLVAIIVGFINIAKFL
jgi:hypothetical protein